MIYTYDSHRVGCEYFVACQYNEICDVGKHVNHRDERHRDANCTWKIPEKKKKVK